MPARRFWKMNEQIERIRAEQEIREIQRNLLMHPPQSQDGLRAIENHLSVLTLEIGETARLRRNIYVAPESSAKEKFLRITG